MFAKYLLLIVTEGCEWYPGKWIELVPLQPSAKFRGFRTTGHCVQIADYHVTVRDVVVEQVY